MPDRLTGALGLIQFLFNGAAARYAQVIDATHAPLAADFAAWVDLDPSDYVLDVGTGTGAIARLIAPRVRAVIALDIAWEMLRLARSLAPDGLFPVVADIHHLPLRAQQFDVIMSSLGLNATDPARSLRTLRRVLAPGGQLVIQEWGPMTELDHAFADAFADCLCDDPPADLAVLREALGTWPGEWGDHVQDVDDYAEWLGEVGLHVDYAAEIAPVALALHIDQFIAYKLAWTDRYLEMAALAPTARAACEVAIRDRLAALATPAGVLNWRPVVFRVRARGYG